MAKADISNLTQAITVSEFQTLLGNSALNTNQKNIIGSIFDKISQGDGELSVEDWNNFITEVDNNKDGELSAAEIGKAIQKKTSSLYRQKCNEVINFYNIVKRYIENKYQSVVTNEDGSQEIFYSPSNAGRATSNKIGSFEKNWLLEDNYGSRTYEEWLANNGYEFDQTTADELYKNASKKDNNASYKGKCASAIRVSMENTAGSETDRLLAKSPNGVNPKNAYQYAEILSENPNFRELPYNIVSTMDLTTLPKGCVIVYDAGYKSGPHPHGHIAVTDGTGYDSGGGHYKMENETGKQDTHIRVFVPVIERR